ncbi:MAG: arsenosugar biosynthesis radical SAM (seleno)protein ArsS [Chitinophagales bacterium]|nr:arsenosugar biosynthesis radical SAM protein ArsS [Bacteroidota bacterium]MBK8681015.1 arsenosugar biosynthesis radical SAM protein ArsS [Bacteroidota bacterium]
MSIQKSLHKQHHKLADNAYQLKVLDTHEVLTIDLPKFESKLKEHQIFPLTPVRTEIFQVNVGYMCNQTCAHCHVDAGPDRKEIMTRETMQQCIDVLAATDIPTVDLTGGAPEMNPDFRWFVEEISKLNRKILVRCNLTIILANKKYHDLPEFFKLHKVEVISSLPYYNKSRTDSQRGDGVFEASIQALQMLNNIGYGKPDSDLILNLVYNPGGAFLPGSQLMLEQQFKKELKKNFDIEFNSLFCMTNLPISRYLDYLIESGNYESYMEKLVNAFNPGAALNVMCRNTISVGWEGTIYDCDFNQMLGLKVDANAPQHINEFDIEKLKNRQIVFNQHCYGCTAGAGSSCGGAVA